MLRDGIGRQDRMMQSRHEFALLVDIAIDDKFDHIRADIDITQQGAALGAGTVGGDALALGFEIGQHFAQIGLQLLDTWAKLT